MEETKSFLGRGWNFPVAFTSKGGEVLMASNSLDIEQSLTILFTTERSERLMHPVFGTALKQFLFEEITLSTISSMQDEITNAISLYESRISVTNVDINQSPSNEAMLLINIEYTINGTNTRSNKVYPFYLNEGTLQAINYE